MTIKPPPFLAALVRLLLPPGDREHVLGDLQERLGLGRGDPARQYLADAIETVPLVIWGRMRRRIADPLFMAEVFTLFSAFIAMLSIERLAASFAFTLMTTSVLLVADVYGAKLCRSPWRLLTTLGAAVGAAWMGNLVASASGVSWAVPGNAMARASVFALLLISWMRFVHVFRRADRYLDRPVPASLAELQDDVRRFQESIRKRNRFAYAMCVMMAALFSRMAIVTSQPGHSLGAWLIVAGVAYLAYQVSHFPAAPQGTFDADYASSLRFYRGELLRQRGFHSHRTLWLRISALVPGLLLLSVFRFVGPSGSAERAGVIAGTCIALAIVAIRLNLQVARRYDRLIALVDKNL